MDEHKTISIHRVYVPDEYTIYLNPTDREQFAAYETQMRTELAEYLVEHARREGYSVPSRPLVLIETEPELTVGTFGIAVATQDGDGAEPIDAPSRRVRRAAPIPVAGRRGPRAAAARAHARDHAAPCRHDDLHASPAEQEEVATLTWDGSALRSAAAGDR